MQTETKTKTSILEANLSQLPMMKHYSKDEIVTKVDNFRKGFIPEKGLFGFLKLLTIVGAGALTWIYVLPPVFQAIGQALALVATGVVLVFSILMAPVIFKGLRRLTRAIHKRIIKRDPFGQLEEERQKMIQNQATFRIAKSNIAALKQDMEIEASNSEKEATAGQTKILTLQGKAEKYKADMDAMVKSKGVEAKSEDEYVQNAADLQKVLADAQ